MEEQLFVVTASNPEAASHVAKSISSPIDLAFCQQHFEQPVLEDVARNSSDGNLYAWGAVPGQRNLPNWEKMKTGNHVLVYQNGRFTYWTRAISKHRSVDFAKALWGTDENGKTWELMYFLQPATPLQCSAQQTADMLPAQYQGFSPLARIS